MMLSKKAKSILVSGVISVSSIFFIGMYVENALPANAMEPEGIHEFLETVEEVKETSVEKEIDVLAPVESKQVTRGQKKEIELSKVEEKEVEKNDDKKAEKEVKQEVAQEKETAATEKTQEKSTTQQVQKETDKASPVVTTKEVKETIAISFETVTKNDDSIEKGKSFVQTEGKNGAKQVTYKETYTNGSFTSKELVSETITSNPVNKVVVVGTKVEPQALKVLDASILSKSGNTYLYIEDGWTVLKVVTDGSKVTSITFDGGNYYANDYITEQLLINEHGAEAGKKMYKQNQQAMKNTEAAIRAAANAVGGGDSLYKEILNGGGSLKGYSKNF